MEIGDCNWWECVNTVRVQRELLIQNRRLAMCHLGLRFAAGCVVIYNIVWSQPWWKVFEPQGAALELWGADFEGLADLNGSLCSPSRLESLRFEYDDTHVYSPTRCADLPQGEKFTKTAGMLTFPTYITDTYVQMDHGEANCATIEEGCSARGGSLVRHGSQCTCTKVEEFVVSDVERNMINLNHGYSVFMDASGQYVQMGRSTSTADYEVRYGSGWGETKIGDGVLTVITRPDGSECEVSGKSRWYAEAGIRGTLEEWLSCGGMSLDQTSKELRANPSQPEPYVRITGAKLELELQYTNFDSGERYNHDGVVCTLIVHAVPVWNSFTNIAYSIVPMSTDHSEPVSYRYRYAYGVTVSIKVSGSFGFLDWAMFFTAIMANLVLLNLPHQLVQFIAMHGAGVTSRVYRRAASKVFNIQGEFHGYCARLVGHANTFRSLTGDSVGKGCEALALTMNEFHSHILEAFGNHKGHMPKVSEEEIMKHESFSRQDIVKVAAVIATLCDLDGDGEVKLREFVTSASGAEDINLDDAMLFFDFNRKRRLPERIFGVQPFTAEQQHRAVQFMQPDIESKVQPQEAKYRSDDQKASSPIELEDQRDVLASSTSAVVQQAVEEARRILRSDLQETVQRAVAHAMSEAKDSKSKGNVPASATHLGGEVDISHGRVREVCSSPGSDRSSAVASSAASNKIPSKKSNKMRPIGSELADLVEAQYETMSLASSRPTSRASTPERSRTDSRASSPESRRPESRSSTPESRRCDGKQRNKIPRYGQADSDSPSGNSQQNEGIKRSLRPRAVPPGSNGVISRAPACPTGEGRTLRVAARLKPRHANPSRGQGEDRRGGALETKFRQGGLMGEEIPETGDWAPVKAQGLRGELGDWSI